ncbi:MAG: energy-coupling factor ABC transporter ATP-binding protein [Candidatus Acidiferrales bacterium]
MPAPVFELRDITFRYHKVTALDSLNLSLPAGQRIALLGPNGSGKSTLLHILDGLLFPQKGSVLFQGEPLTPERLQNEEFSFQFRRRVGFVFQNPDVQLFSPTVFDELAFGPLQLRWCKEDIRRAVAEMLDRMEIAHLRDRTPQHLSMGEKKRVALASVLILDPVVLLLDEPTAALDPRSASRMIDFLARCIQPSKTVITATHDLDIVEDIADACYVFQDGCLVAEGGPSEILADNSMLERTSLVHSHLHKHASGKVHAHPHLHRHTH